MTPEEIETTTMAELWGKFPHADCRWLQQHGGTHEGLIPDLDVYFATVVGFAMSATRLDQRQPEQLQKYLKNLRMTFFEMHPEHALLEARINKQDTPELERRLRVTNIVRLEILPIMERLANGKAAKSEQ
jgi:hypothetical protein